MSFMSELLSRCENSDDADKRELVVYVNKLDAIRDSLERQLWMSKNETTRAQNRSAALCVKLNELKARIKEEDADLQAADDEIDELHEKYRWRKQEEDPAPADVRVLFCNSFGIGAIGTAWGQDIPAYEIPTGGVAYWRPLDFPENPDVHAE